MNLETVEKLSHFNFESYKSQVYLQVVLEGVTCTLVTVEANWERDLMYMYCSLCELPKTLDLGVAAKGTCN